MIKFYLIFVVLVVAIFSAIFFCPISIQLELDDAAMLRAFELIRDQLPNHELGAIGHGETTYIVVKGWGLTNLANKLASDPKLIRANAKVFVKNAFGFRWNYEGKAVQTCVLLGIFSDRNTTKMANINPTCLTYKPSV